MSRRDVRVALRQLRSHAQEAVALTNDKKRGDLDSDRLLYLALTRLLEIAGEAANRVPVPFREQRPQVPWQKIIGLRNRLIHGYDRVNLDILWATTRADLPRLVMQIEEILAWIFHKGSKREASEARGYKAREGWRAEAYLDSTVSTASERNEVDAGLSRLAADTL
jgi:uncharacterized protein with HEPN domain